MVKKEKAEKILDAVLELLTAKGDHGVTMRQVALKTGMSLSNVQYYYKDKNEILKALADRYFQSCLNDLGQIPVINKDAKLVDNSMKVLGDFLGHGLKVSETCRIFREYWAISTRSEAIDVHIKNYYRKMAEIIGKIFKPIAVNEGSLLRAVSIIIPYVEGYSITALAMPINHQEATSNLTDVVLSLLKSDQ